MLEVSLNRLSREGEARLEAQVPTDDPMWEGLGLEWMEPVAVHLRAAAAGTGEVVVRGNVSGKLRQECRRCLETLEVDVDEDVTLVFSEPSDVEDDDPDGEIRLLPATGDRLDLSQAVREEMVLAIDPYVLCDAACKGLCPRCGQDLSEGSCSCVDDEPDPRWDALRSLKDR